MLEIADNLKLPLEAITQTFGVLAMRGAGKSNLAAVMAEEMFEAGLPFVVVDPVGAWWGLRSDASGRGKGLAVPIFGGRRGDVPLERTGGQLVADLVVDERLSLVLDVSEFSEGDKVRFLIDFAERLYRRNTDPLHLFLEEADDYCPQRPFREQARLLRAWENVVRRGRARGLGITMITQRSAALNKSVLTQIGTLFVLRTTGPQDRKAIEAWVVHQGKSRELLDSLPSLGPGEAWVWSPEFLKDEKRVQIRRRWTFDSGATPKDVRGKRRPATLVDVDLAKVKTAMSATIERAKAEDPRELKREVARLRAEVAKLEAAPAAKARRVEVRVVKPAELKRMEALAGRAEKAAESIRRLAEEQLGTATAKLLGAAKDVRACVLPFLPGTAAPPRGRPADYAGAMRAVQRIELEAARTWKGPKFVDVDAGDGPSAPTRPQVGTRKAPATAGADGVTRVEQKVLDAMAELEALGARAPKRELVAFLAGYSNLTSKGFANAIGALRSGGLIDYPTPGQMVLTEDGRARAVAPARPRSPAEVQERVLELLGGSHAKVLRPLLEAYPAALDREEHAGRAGYTNLTSKGYAKAIGRLRSLGFIDYPGRGTVQAMPVLFLEGGRGRRMDPGARARVRREYVAPRAETFPVPRAEIARALRALVAWGEWTVEWQELPGAPVRLWRLKACGPKAKVKVKPEPPRWADWPPPDEPPAPTAEVLWRPRAVEFLRVRGGARG